MIDVENEVFTNVKTALTEQFPNISVEGVTNNSPSKFPFVCIEETDNYSYTSTRDTNSNENHATVDTVMLGLGFTRNAKTPINLDDATKYRIFARYTAVVSRTDIIYRR